MGGITIIYLFISKEAIDDTGKGIPEKNNLFIIFLI